MIRRRLDVVHQPALRLARPDGVEGAPRRARRQQQGVVMAAARMRVGINGMGRIGRLALRAAMGGVRRPDGDPRAGNRLDVVHVNELKGGIAATAHLLEFDSLHGRWHAGIGVPRRQTHRHRRSAASASRSAALPGDVAWGDLGCDIVLECTGKFLKPGAAAGLLRPRREAGDRGRAGEGRRRAQHRGRRQRPSLRSRPAPAADGRLLHHQLPGAGGEGDARGDRHPPRPDHDHPRSDQHQCRRRCAAQGSAPRTLGDAVAAADHDRQRHRDRADLSGAEGQAERPCGARAGAERQPDRLRVRAEARDQRGRGQRAVRSGRRRARSPASSATRRGRWSRPTTATIRAARSSTRRARW